MKQYELAIGLRSEGNTPGAFKSLYQALELDPYNAKAHLLLGSMFLLGRQDGVELIGPSPAGPGAYDEEAEEHFRKVLEIQASDRRQSEESLVPDARNGLGVLYIHQRRYQEAVAELTKAVEDLFNRQGYMAWGNLGWAYHEMGDLERAAEALVRAVQLHPRFCVGYYRLGKVYAELEKLEKAEQALTSAIEVDERCDVFQDAWHLRGEVRMKLGRRDDARADFERCVELSAGNESGEACRRYLEATY